MALTAGVPRHDCWLKRIYVWKGSRDNFISGSCRKRCQVDSNKHQVLQLHITDKVQLNHHKGVNMRWVLEKPQLLLHVTDVWVVTSHICVNSSRQNAANITRAVVVRVCKSRQNHQGTKLGKSTKKTHYVEDSLQSNEQSMIINNTYNLYHCWEWTQPHCSGTGCDLQYSSSIITFMVEISSMS